MKSLRLCSKIDFSHSAEGTCSPSKLPCVSHLPLFHCMVWTYHRQAIHLLENMWASPVLDCSVQSCCQHLHAGFYISVVPFSGRNAECTRCVSWEAHVQCCRVLPAELFPGAIAPFPIPLAVLSDRISLHSHWHLLLLVLFVLALWTDVHWSLLFKTYLSRYSSKAKDTFNRKGFRGEQ